MRLVLHLIAFGFFLLIGGLAAGFIMLQQIAKDLPDYRQLADYQPPVVTRLHAADGRMMAEFATEKRVFVPVTAIPKRVIDAFMAAEDKTFFEHHGLDYPGIARAFVTNLTTDSTVGASTITQQVAKNFLLSREKSYLRKAREAILAVRIEQTYTKQQILELYLNEINLGAGAYGVAAASLTYFNKSLDEMSIEDAAMLAALPKAPTNYNPRLHYERAITRRNWVLDRMAVNGVITQTEADLAKARPIALAEAAKTQYVGSQYFVEEVRRALKDRFGDNGLYGGGLSVRTTMDPHLQDLATSALRNGLMAYDMRHGYRGPVTRLEGLTPENWQEQLKAVAVPKGATPWRLGLVLDNRTAPFRLGFADGTTGLLPESAWRWTGRRPLLGDVILAEAEGSGEPGPETTYLLRQIPAVQGAIIALDPHTGRVLAMQGGFSSEMSEFNRATQALRQPGSSIKPFVYLTALEQGLTPSSLVQDAPFELSQAGQAVWRPNNYGHDFLGPTPLRVGIEKSRNLMTVRLADYIGMEHVANTALRFGIYDKVDHPVLSLALGAGETTLFRMVTAYAMLVNGGKRIVPTMVDRVQDRNGKTVYRHDSRVCADCVQASWGSQATPELPDGRSQVVDGRYAYQMVEMLQGVVQRGTAATLRSLNRPLAGKTGTSNDAKDVWFVGFSPDLVCGVFVGFDTPRSLGAKETGGSVAVPIFKAFMGEALADTPATPFRMPRGLRLVRVNATDGELTDGDDPKAIWEAYIPGTEPTGDSGEVLGGDAEGGVDMMMPTTDPTGADAPDTGTGTGTLY